MLDQRIIEQVIDGNDIVSVVEQYLPLKKTGANFKACCPFHEEKTPSFVVSDKKQIFKCFGCGKGGNVIHFVKEIENITFFEALEKLALKAGIKIHQRGTAKTKERSRQTLLLSVYRLANDYYRENLSRFGDSILKYLKKRGISEETIRKFELGYALKSSSGLYNHLLKCEINRTLLENSGLFLKTQRGLLDLFRERLIFPIYNAKGDVVAFGARILSDEPNAPKYVNSPTTELYTKGKELYGFHLTKNEIRKKDYAIVTEGYTDFLRLYEAGFTNCVASLGTAFSNEQIKLLSRYSNNIFLLFDSDLAGMNAAVKAAGNALINGANPRIVTLPFGEDADSFLLKNSSGDLQKLIDNGESPGAFLYKNEALKLNTKDKLVILTDIANQINDQLDRELFLKEIAQSFNVTLNSLVQRIKTWQRRGKTEQPVNKKRMNPFRFLEEKNFLVFLVNGLIEDRKTFAEIDSSFFFNESYKKVFETLSSFDYIIDNGKIPSILADLEEKDEMQIKVISELLLAEIPPIHYSKIVNDLKIRKYLNDLKRLDEADSEEHDRITLNNRKKELLDKIRATSHKVIP